MPDPNPAEVAREAFDSLGDSIADNLEQAFGTLADTLARVMVEQAELRDELHSLGVRLDSIERGNAAATLRSAHTGTYRAGE